VDIFDAGPIFRAKRETLRSWKNSLVLKLQAGTPDPASSKTVLLANQSLEFRALMADVSLPDNESAIVSPEVIQLLNPGSDNTALLLQQ
jgi:arginine/ornithine N-succinyltransferase beta subunit